MSRNRIYAHQRFRVGPTCLLLRHASLVGISRRPCAPNAVSSLVKPLTYRSRARLFHRVLTLPPTRISSTPASPRRRGGRGGQRRPGWPCRCRRVSTSEAAADAALGIHQPGHQAGRGAGPAGWHRDARKYSGTHFRVPPPAVGLVVLGASPAAGLLPPPAGAGVSAAASGRTLSAYDLVRVQPRSPRRAARRVPAVQRTPYAQAGRVGAAWPTRPSGRVSEMSPSSVAKVTTGMPAAPGKPRS